MASKGARSSNTHEVEQRAGQQALVAQLGLEALREPDTEVLLRRICHTMLAALDVDSGLILTRRDDETLDVRSMCQLNGTVSPPERLDDEAVLFARNVLDHGKPEVVDDWAAALGTPPEAGLRSSVAVPIPGPERPLGVLIAHSLSPHAFDTDDAHFLQALANIAGAASERTRSEALVRHAAMHDALTGLPNRLALSDRLEHGLAGLRRDGTGLAVLFLDLDNFKDINDSLGHGAGDAFLRLVAERLLRVLRPEDTVARFGGDEFVLMCERVPTAALAIELAERVLLALRAPMELVGNAATELVHPAASIGIAHTRDPDLTPESLLRDADIAMYRAKDTGRGRAVLFLPELASRRANERRLETELRRGLEAGELQVHYQPTIDLDRRQIVGAEALVRWDHPERGLLLPADFLPVARRAGLISTIGTLVLNAALREAGNWPHPLYLSVNVDPGQLGDPAALRSIHAALDLGLCPAERVVLEITETALLDTGTETLRALRELRERKVRVAIDDFGTGYSSLSYLARLPIDMLKIDRSFVEQLHLPAVGGEALAISRLIINLGHTLGLHVLAEGAETAQQLDILGELGCDGAQGFHIGRPVPPADFRALLARRRRP